MVGYDQVHASNAEIASTLPAGLVAVFVGGTNGIGEYTLKKFVQSTTKGRIYFYGRSPEVGARIEAECQRLNPQAVITFIRADTSLIQNVDTLCRDLKARETTINLLFLSTGTLDNRTGLRLSTALVHYCRARFIHNLLPELQRAVGLKRVVSVHTGSKEGDLDLSNLNGDGLSFFQKRAHTSSLVTLGMESFARQAPDVSFIHDFPGAVKSGIARDLPGIVGTVARGLMAVAGPFFYIPTDKSGDYHLFLATSSRYPARDRQDGGIPLGTDLAAACGVDGLEGSGMYSIDECGECAGSDAQQLLLQMRNDGYVEKVRDNLEHEWNRIATASSSLL